MDDYIDYRQTEVLTAREVQEILKVGNKTVYRLFAGDCPFRVVKIPGGYRIHAKSFFEWLDGKRKKDYIPAEACEEQVWEVLHKLLDRILNLKKAVCSTGHPGGSRISRQLLIFMVQFEENVVQ